MPGIGESGDVNDRAASAGVPPPSSTTIRVAIVDDQAMVRQGFGALLDAQTDMHVVGSAEDGSAVVDLVRRTDPDVILMDIRMPGLNGLDATRAVFSMPGDHPRIVMLTTFDADEYVFSALRVVGVGDSLLAPSVTRRLIAEYVAGPTVVKDTAVLGQLTDREIDVMRLVAKGHANAEVAKQLFLAEQTVKTHVSRILSK